MVHEELLGGEVEVVCDDMRNTFQRTMACWPIRLFVDRNIVGGDARPDKGYTALVCYMLFILPYVLTWIILPLILAGPGSMPPMPLIVASLVFSAVLHLFWNL